MAEDIHVFVKRCGFLSASQAEQIRLLAWYMHTEQQRERLVTSDFRELFHELHLDVPNVSRYLSYQSEGKARSFIRDRKGFRLEGKTRARMSKAYDCEVEMLAVRSILLEVVESISEGEQRIFAEEALRCHSVRAFRATVVMAWNLAYDHLCHWIFADLERLDKFSRSFAVKFPKSTVKLNMVTSLSDISEFNVIETASHASLFTKNISDILKEKLKKRNAAAHPSNVSITQSQAEDVITDLIVNVVRKLT